MISSVSPLLTTMVLGMSESTIGAQHGSKEARLHSHWFLPTMSFLLLFAIVQLHHHGHSCNSSQHLMTYNRSQNLTPKLPSPFIKTIQEKHLQAPLHSSRSIDRMLDDDLSRRRAANRLLFEIKVEPTSKRQELISRSIRDELILAPNQTIFKLWRLA